MKEKTKNICEGHMKILIITTYRLDSKKNPPEAAKVPTSVKLFNVEKTFSWYGFQVCDIEFLQPSLHTSVCSVIKPLLYKSYKKY